MTVYVHRGYLCLKYRLYRHTCQMILLTFAHFIKNSTVSKLCRNCLIKTEPIENSKSDRRLAEKELQITRKLAQLEGKGGQSASVTAPNAVKMTRTVGKLARTTFLGRRSLRRLLVMNDELLVMNITCTFFSSFFYFSKHSSFSPKGSRSPQKGTPNRGAMLRAHEGLLKLTHLHNLLAANLLSKLVPLLSFYYPKLWRPVISCRADAPSRLFHNIFGKSVNLTLGRTAIFRDERPICSTVPGRTTASWDKRRGLAGASNDRQLGEKSLQITRKLAQLVGKGGRPAFDERRDATKGVPNAVKRGRNA